MAVSMMAVVASIFFASVESQPLISHSRSVTFPDGLRLNNVYSQEHTKRLKAENLVKKISNVLNATTVSLKQKDQLLAADEQFIKAQTAVEAKEQKELKVAHQDEDVLKGALDKERETSTALRERQGEFASHSEQSMNDMHRVMADEREMRLASQAKVTQVQLKLKGVKEDFWKVSADLTGAKESLVQKDFELEHEKTDLVKAQKEMASLRQRLADAGRANEEKTSEIGKEVKTVQEVKTDETVKLAQMKKQLEEEEQKHQQDDHVEKSSAQAAFAKLYLQNKDLSSANKKLQDEVSIENQHLQSITKIARTQHQKAVDEAQALARSQMQIRLLGGVEKQVVALSDTNAQLRKAYEEKVNAVKQAEQGKFHVEEALDSTHDSLKKSLQKLQALTQGKKTSDTHVRQLWAALKHKRAELESLVKQGDAANQQLQAKVAAKDKELGEVHAKVADQEKVLNAMYKQVDQDATAKKELSETRSKLANTEAEEKELVDQLALASQQTQEKVAAESNKEQELAMQLDSEKSVLASVNAMKSGDEAKLEVEAKELTSKEQEIDALDESQEKLHQTLEKVSTALVKEHSEVTHEEATVKELRSFVKHTQAAGFLGPDHKK